MEQLLKNDISVLSNFLQFFQIFSRYREILPNFIFMPNYRSIGHSNRNYRGGGAESAPLPPAIPICEKPGLFRINYASLEREFFEIKIV